VVQAHRLHHAKFQQDEDPYYSKHSFMYAQVRGGLLKYSPQQEELLKDVDMSDLESDPVVMFQKRWDFIKSDLLIYLTGYPIYFPDSMSCCISF